MRYPIVDEEADPRVVEEILRLEGLKVGGHYYGWVRWEGRGGMGGAAGEEGIVHQRDVGEGRRGGCWVCYGCEVELHGILSGKIHRWVGFACVRSGHFRDRL